MNALLVNDTSNWHPGSAAAVEAIIAEIERLGHSVVGSVRTRGTLGAVPRLVVVNGEGTVHDDRAHYGARWLMECIRKARNAKATVWLVNSLWCRMSQEAAETVEHCVSYFQVREPISQIEAQKWGLTPELMLDASVNDTDPWWLTFNDRYTDNGAVYTPFHHGVLAAMMAEMPWVYGPPLDPPPTHKVDGLVKWLDMLTPQLDNLWAIDWALVSRKFALLPRFRLPDELAA